MKWDSAERRKYVRVKFPCDIIIRGPRKQTIFVYAENISIGGVRVILEKSLKVSSSVDLEISGVKKKSVICKGRIKWVVERKTIGREPISLFDTGIEFYEIKDTDAKNIKKLVASVVSGKIKPSLSKSKSKL